MDLVSTPPSLMIDQGKGCTCTTARTASLPCVERSGLMEGLPCFPQIHYTNGWLIRVKAVSIRPPNSNTWGPSSNIPGVPRLIIYLNLRTTLGPGKSAQCSFYQFVLLDDQRFHLKKVSGYELFLLFYSTTSVAKVEANYSSLLTECLGFMSRPWLLDLARLL